MRKSSIAVVVLFLAACTASPPVPVPPEPTRPAPPPDVSAATCADGLPGEWTDRLRDGVLSVDAEKPRLAASSEDARTVFVTDEATRLLMLRDGRHQEVFSASDGRSVTGVDFDGRWLTFAVRVVNYSWIAYAWDSESDAEPFVVAEHNGRDYAPPPRTFVRRGTAIWLMGGELRLHDLRTRQHQVFARGVRDNPVVFGDMVIWQGEGLQAFSISERRPVDVPEVLPPADTSTNLAADDLTVAWVQDDVLRAWRPGWPEARPWSA